MPATVLNASVILILAPLHKLILTAKNLLRRSKIQFCSKTGSAIRRLEFAFGSPNFLKERPAGSTSCKPKG